MTRFAIVWGEVAMATRLMACIQDQSVSDADLEEVLQECAYYAEGEDDPTDDVHVLRIVSESIREAMKESDDESGRSTPS